MGHKQYAHEEGESTTSSLTVRKLLKFALDKYTDRSRIDNHVWGLSSKREEEFFALADEVTTLKGKLKLDERIATNQKHRGGGGGAAQRPGQATIAIPRSKSQRAPTYGRASALH